MLIKITVCGLTSRFDEESKVVNAEYKIVILLSLKIYDSWIKTMSLFIVKFNKKCITLIFLM